MMERDHPTHPRDALKNRQLSPLRRVEEKDKTVKLIKCLVLCALLGGCAEFHQETKSDRGTVKVDDKNYVVYRKTVITQNTDGWYKQCMEDRRRQMEMRQNAQNIWWYIDDQAACFSQAEYGQTTNGPSWNFQLNPTGSPLLY
jgi:hypothetical protein